MRNPRQRFGVHKVKKGNYKDCLHIATDKFMIFHGDLCYLYEYLNSRILSSKPEEVKIAGILLNLENIMDYESEELIKHYVKNNPSKPDQQFKKKIDDGYVNFKCKYEWLRSRSLISQKEINIMEEIRILRNVHIHIKPTARRIKRKYFDKPLLTTSSLRRLFIDVGMVLKNIMAQSKRKCEWLIVPPGYATEMNWPKSAIEIFDK